MRLPEEPLVVRPYDSIGKYGGTINFLSNATEAGTSDMLSTRHVNLLRFADDLSTIVPNVAKSFEWNDDFTTLTLHLEKDISGQMENHLLLEILNFGMKI